MKKTRKHPKPVEAEEIAPFWRIRGRTSPAFSRSEARMVQPIQRVNVDLTAGMLERVGLSCQGSQRQPPGRDQDSRVPSARPALCSSAGRSGQRIERCKPSQRRPTPESVLHRAAWSVSAAPSLAICAPAARPGVCVTRSRDTASSSPVFTAACSSLQSASAPRRAGC